MSKQQPNQIPSLYPADIEDILDKFNGLLASYPNLKEKNSIYASFKLTDRKLDVLFPLKEHPVHGITGLHAIEKYDKHGFVKQYHYQWKRIIPKEGINFSHISAWENEPHDAPNTPAAFKIETEPHQHHHIPGKRNYRKENYDIHTLEAAFEFIARFIMSGDEYRP